MFRKVLARFYHKWYRDCYDSAMYCIQQGDEISAERYLDNMQKYWHIICDNYDAIEFFSAVGDRAFMIDSALPEEFRNYE